jgi:hypothetical protein
MTWLIVTEYRVSVSQMTIDKFHLSQTLPSSFPIHHQVCNYSNTTGATSGEGTAYPSGATEFNPVFSGVLVTRSLVFYVLFLRLFFVLFVLFFEPLYCLSFDLRILITSLVSSNSSYMKTITWCRSGGR